MGKTASWDGKSFQNFLATDYGYKDQFENDRGTFDSEAYAEDLAYGGGPRQGFLQPLIDAGIPRDKYQYYADKAKITNVNSKGDLNDIIAAYNADQQPVSAPEPEQEKEKKDKEDKSDPVPRPFTPEQITEAGEQLDSNFADGKNPYGMPDPRELYENSFTTAKNMGQDWDANFYVRELANGLNNQTTDYMNYLNDKNEYNTLRNGQEQLDYLERLGDMGVKIPSYKDPMSYVDDFEDMMDKFS